MRHKEPARITPEPTPKTKAIFDLRHTKTCSIAYFREEMEKIERSCNKALAELEALKAESATKAKPKAKDIPCIVHPIEDVQETQQEEQP